MCCHLKGYSMAAAAWTAEVTRSLSDATTMIRRSNSMAANRLRSASICTWESANRNLSENKGLHCKSLPVQRPKGRADGDATMVFANANLGRGPIFAWERLSWRQLLSFKAPHKAAWWCSVASSSPAGSSTEAGLELCLHSSSHCHCMGAPPAQCSAQYCSTDSRVAVSVHINGHAAGATIWARLGLQ